MQLNLPDSIRAALIHGLAAVFALTAAAAISLSSQAHAARPLEPSAPTLVSGSEPLPPAHEQLFRQARAWVMKQPAAPSEPAQFAPLDSRVQIGNCGAALQFDYPFSSSRETVRVRCPQPAPWQMFLRLASKTAPVTATPAPSAARPATAVGGAASPAAASPVILQAPQRQVVVARQLIKRGTELTPALLEEVQRPAQGLDPLAVASIKDLENAETIRDIPAGTVLRSYDTKRALMVRKGQSAMMTVGQGQAFQISVKVEAQQDGYLGEQIRLKNTESGRLISGVVTGPNAVKGL